MINPYELAARLADLADPYTTEGMASTVAAEADEAIKRSHSAVIVVPMIKEPCSAAARRLAAERYRAVGWLAYPHHGTSCLLVLALPSAEREFMATISEVTRLG